MPSSQYVCIVVIDAYAQPERLDGLQAGTETGVGDRALSQPSATVQSRSAHEGYSSM